MKTKELFLIKNSPLSHIIGYLYCMAINILWIPALFLGFYCLNHTDESYGLLWYFLGTVIGIVFHELAHLLCVFKHSRATAATIGVGHMRFVPFFYVEYKDELLTKKQNVEVGLAGVKLNVVLFAVFAFCSAFIDSVFYIAAVVNLFLTVSNLVIKNSDGLQCINFLLGFDLFESCKTALKTNVSANTKLIAFLVLCLQKTAVVVTFLVFQLYT